MGSGIEQFAWREHLKWSIKAIFIYVYRVYKLLWLMEIQ